MNINEVHERFHSLLKGKFNIRKHFTNYIWMKHVLLALEEQKKTNILMEFLQTSSNKLKIDFQSAYKVPYTFKSRKNTNNLTKISTTAQNLAK